MRFSRDVAVLLIVVELLLDEFNISRDLLILLPIKDNEKSKN